MSGNITKLAAAEFFPRFPSNAAMKVSIENRGSLFLARPAGDETRKHLEENVTAEAQWFGGALVVEPHYIDDFITAFEANGGEVS